jgi:hypothetical protein
MKIINRLFCKHDYFWRRNIYGDEINAVNGKRSWVVCSRCGKWKAKDKLEEYGREFE